MTSVPAAAGEGQSFEVNQDNVLAARAAILRAADDALHRLEQLQHEMRMRPCGDDLISKEAAEVWNDRLVDSTDSHATRLADYVHSVRDLGNRLEDVAKHYGYTEDEIAASFPSVSARV